MNRAHLLAVVVVTLGPMPCFAQFQVKQVEKWKVEVKMADNRALEGVLALATLRIECDLGDYAIKAEKIKEVRFPEQKDSSAIVNSVGTPIRVRGTIVTTSVEEFSGIIDFPREGIETDLGTLKLNPMKLRTLTFKGKQTGPL